MRRRLPWVLLFAAARAGAWTVCLDPGHGGGDPGATGTYFQEKNANLNVAVEAAGLLASLPACEWVGMTRTGDYHVSLAGRVEYANTNGFDRFVSIHENAFNTQVQGSETFCHTPSPGYPGFELASRVLDGILWAHAYSDRGVKDGSWLYVIANTTMPAILGEGTFIDYDGSWNESQRYLTNWNDHMGRQGYGYAAGIGLHMGSSLPEYGSQGHVVDNLSLGFSVNVEDRWSAGDMGNPWCLNYRWSSTSNQSDWARWTPTLPQDGWHQVAVWYTDGGNRASDAIYVVTHSEGESQFTVDQTVNGGRWNPLGVFFFHAGNSGWVTLEEQGAEPGKVVVADAVRFLPAPEGVQGPGHAPVAENGSFRVSPGFGRVFDLLLFLPEGSRVEIHVFDMAGRLVRTPWEGFLDPGAHSLRWEASGIPAGIYSVRVTAGLWSRTERVAVSP